MLPWLLAPPGGTGIVTHSSKHHYSRSDGSSLHANCSAIWFRIPRMDREPKCWPEKAQLGGCYKESCQRRGRGAIWRGTLSDSFARKKAREVSQHLHRYSRSRQAPVESLITTAKAECDVNDSLRAVRLCIEDTVVGTALQNLHRKFLERESAWQTLRKTGIDNSALAQNSGNHGAAFKIYNILPVSTRSTQRDDLSYRLNSQSIWSLIQSY